MQTDLGIGAAALRLRRGLFFVGYALFEVPSNVMMQKYGARAWLTRIMGTWGMVAAAMAFVWNETSFYVLRFLLGVAEAGFFPAWCFTSRSGCRRSRTRQGDGGFPERFGARVDPVRSGHRQPAVIRRLRPARLAVDVHHRRRFLDRCCAR
jgi:hypothetical protein